jgi:hypothetical protein
LNFCCADEPTGRRRAAQQRRTKACQGALVRVIRVMD